MRHTRLGAAALLAATAFMAGRSDGQFPGGGPPGGGGGGPPGGFGRGGFSPDMVWSIYAKGRDVIDTNADPEIKARLQSKGHVIPPNGIITKDQFVAGLQQRMAERGMSFPQPGGAPPGAAPTASVAPAPGAPPGMGGPPGGFGGFSRGGNSEADIERRFRDYDRNGDGRLARDETRGSTHDNFATVDTNKDGFVDLGEYKAFQIARNGPPSPGGPPQGFPPGSPPQGFQPGGGRDERREERREPEEPKPVAVRYGKLPKELPEWFTKLDTDKDGQIGLYEWRKDGRATADFVEMDLNADGLVTADEWLRCQKLTSDRRKIDDLYIAAGGEAEGTPSAVAAAAAGKPLATASAASTASARPADKTADRGGDRRSGPSRGGFGSGSGGFGGGGFGGGGFSRGPSDSGRSKGDSRR